MWVQSAPQVLSSSQRSVTGSVDQRKNALQAGSRDLPRNIRPLLSFLVRRDRAFGATLGALGAGRQRGRFADKKNSGHPTKFAFVAGPGSGLGAPRAH